MDDQVFLEVIEKIKSEDIEGIKNLISKKPDIMNYHDIHKFNILYYSCLFSSKKCILFFLEEEYDFTCINENGLSALDILYANYEVNLINENDLQLYFSKLKKIISKHNKTNVIISKIYNCLSKGNNNYIKKLIPLIDLTKNFGIYSYSYNTKQKVFYHFIYLAYHFNNMEFYKQLIKNNITIDQRVNTEIKKMALLENKTDWIPLLEKRKVYREDSPAIVNIVNQILAFN